MGDLAGLQLQGLLQLFSLGTWILDMMTNDDKWWQMMIDVDWSIGQPNSTWRFKQQTWISLYYDLSNIHTQISPRTGLATFHGIFHVGGRLSTIKQHLKRQSNQSSQGQVRSNLPDLPHLEANIMANIHSSSIPDPTFFHMPEPQPQATTPTQPPYPYPHPLPHSPQSQPPTRPYQASWSFTFPSAFDLATNSRSVFCASCAASTFCARCAELRAAFKAAAWVQGRMAWDGDCFVTFCSKSS